MAPRPPMHFLHKTFPGTTGETSHCAKFQSSSCLISWLPKTDLCETTGCSPPLDRQKWLNSWTKASTLSGNAPTSKILIKTVQENVQLYFVHYFYFNISFDTKQIIFTAELVTFEDFQSQHDLFSLGPALMPAESWYWCVCVTLFLHVCLSPNP